MRSGRKCLLREKGVRGRVGAGWGGGLGWGLGGGGGGGWGGGSISCDHEPGEFYQATFRGP